MANIEAFVELLCEVDDPKKMKKVLTEILTESELDAVSLRWALMEQLLKKIPQREIASRLGISLCKITRGVKILKDKKSVIGDFMLNRRTK